MIPFAPELQRDWAFEELRLVRSDEVLVRVAAATARELPGVIGRHGSDILSYPEIISVHCEADFNFSHCVLVRVWDEMGISTIEASPEDVFDGRTFRRFSKSALLAAHAHFPAPVYHYELVCGSIIDILCTEAPSIVLRDGSLAATQPKT